MIYKYQPKGVCSKEFIFDIEDNVIKDLKIIDGCEGNSSGISSLLKGMKIEEVITRLKGITCGRKNTSCPDQISKALEKFLEENK